MKKPIMKKLGAISPPKSHSGKRRNNDIISVKANITFDKTTDTTKLIENNSYNIRKKRERDYSHKLTHTMDTITNTQTYGLQIIQISDNDCTNDDTIIKKGN